jgi:hypothetical protein
MSWVRRAGAVVTAFLALIGACAIFWATTPLPIRQEAMITALAQVGCVPNPNIAGPPNIVNGCPLVASVLNGMLGPSFRFHSVLARSPQAPYPRSLTFDS